MAGVSIENVTKRFGADQPAVTGFSLSIEPGAFLALLGPSGCGKTTLLRMLAGFETPDEGVIRLGDRVLAGPGQFVPPEARNMAMVFQSYALWPHMSVAGNVGYPLKVRGIAGAAYRDRVGRALDAVKMTDFASRNPAELSGGQRQRVALARCLVASPEVILLDEPLANLDRHLRASMEETFREFHQRTGATMIYVTHDQSEAMALADTVAVMSAGRLLQAGAPHEIYRRPDNRAVAALIGAGDVLSLPVGDVASRELDGAAIAAALGGREGPLADVLVRPEDVLPDAGGAEFAVEDCVFKGERYALVLRHGTGARLQAFSPERHAPGATVRCSILRGWRL
ncbi:MAG: ABC transporter ATP-binding protein [Mesorhizobium sp.]|nr:ABC transporter ATP-binding protein [Mesorhizobium sp.]